MLVLIGRVGYLISLLGILNVVRIDSETVVTPQNSWKDTLNPFICSLEVEC